jgi:glutamate synthase (NADPH/NADH) small chain
MSGAQLPGYLRFQRQLPPRRATLERLRDFGELELPQADDELAAQAARCIGCGVPFCQQGCPLGNPIPDFNALVRRGRHHEAYLRLAAINCFPEFTGRLCPAPCEAACTLAFNDQAVTIEAIEKAIIERAFAEGWVQPQPPSTRSGKRVAIVGSGPAGLAAAMMLNRAGHQVTVYEAASQAGGLLRYGIPDFKLDKRVIDRRLALLEAEGVVFRCGVAIGATGRPSWRALRDDHDALVLAMGARIPRELPVPGRELSGTCQAMDYLDRQNRLVAGEDDGAPELDARDKRVVILGGGDTGADCLGTAHRQGARSVTQIELLPEPPETRTAQNPWPHWPLIFRVSSSHEEGGERAFALLTKRLSGDDGKLAKLHAVRVEVENKPGGELAFHEQAGGEIELDVELLLLALGFTGPKTDTMVDQLGLKLDERGNVAVNADYSTSVEGVYAAGDAKRGASLIVWAIAEGRETARAIDAYLRQDAPWLPTRGRDEPFGGR